MLDLRECFPPEGEDASPCWPPDVTFSFHGSDRTISAHRAILAARSPFFREAFSHRWRGRDRVRLTSRRLSYPALVSLFQFFYTDRLDVAVEEMEDLVRICRQCRLPELQAKVEGETNHQKYSDMKWHRLHQNLQRRFVLQVRTGLCFCLPEWRENFPRRRKSSETSEEDDRPAEVFGRFLGQGASIPAEEVCAPSPGTYFLPIVLFSFFILPSVICSCCFRVSSFSQPRQLSKPMNDMKALVDPAFLACHS
jgi:hypothetical protein